MIDKTQIIKPANAKKESLFLLIAIILILLLAGLFIFYNQKPNYNKSLLKPHEVSARFDLNPNEQAIYADIVVAIKNGDLQNYPEIAELIDNDIPPFADQINHINRGDHHWQKIGNHQQNAYLGISQDKEIAGNFLIKNDQIWLTKNIVFPLHLADNELINGKWLLITSKIDQQN